MTMEKAKRFLPDFLEREYLDSYVAAGGSKIKFLTGRPGCGKHEIMAEICRRAVDCGYRTVRFSAKDIWLHDFKDVYLEILRQCDVEACLAGCAAEIIRSMGYDPREIPKDATFMDYLSSIGEGDPVNRREIRQELRKIFLENPRMDNNFAICCSLLCGNILGHPLLEAGSREVLLEWMHGSSNVKLSMLRAQGLSPSRITKLNARHMLRSLVEVICAGGSRGLCVAIDDLEILLNRSGLDEIHYTKNRREDTYESIRQLIDDIDSQNHMMFIYGFDRALIDNENAGLKSYQALWMRIQSEVAGSRFNCFSDMLDLDLLWEQMITPEMITAMSEGLLTDEEAKELKNKCRFGEFGIFEAVNRKITEILKGEETGEEL